MPDLSIFIIGKVGKRLFYMMFFSDSTIFFR